jgi:putrescine aminotransferase
MAKGITSGYIPLGAVGCTDKVMEPITIFNHLHTYGNHPVSCAAGLKTIEILKRDKMVEKSAEMGKYFLERLQTLLTHPIIGEVRGTGLWIAVDFTADKKTRALLPTEHLIKIIKRAMQKGLIIKLAPLRHAIEFAPPFIIQKEEIDTALKIIEECITEEEQDMGL